MNKLSGMAGILASAVLAIQAGVAGAHGSFAFDDPYWKRPVERTAVQPPTALAEAAKQNQKYDFVDHYNR
jgi:hypothetical protein